MRVALPLFAWACWLAVLGVVLLVWSGEWLSPGLLLGAAALVAAIGLVVVARRPGVERAVPDLSLATVAVALGLTATVASALYGVWLLIVGVGLTAAGLAGIARERAAARR